MSDLAWMFVAFAAVAVGLGTYLIWLGARRRRLDRRREELTSDNRADPRH